MRKRLIVLQEGEKDCGAAALLSIIRFYGGDILLDRLIVLTKTDREGTNFYNLSLAAESIGLKSFAYKVDNDSKLEDIGTPFIAQINNNNYMHFVVVYKIEDTKIIIMDPSKGKVVMELFDFVNSFTGNIMLFEKDRNLPVLTGEKILNKIIIYVLLKNKNIIIFIFILSFIFTIFSASTSFYSQVIFDYVIDSTTSNIAIVTLLFSILYIVKIVTSYVRNYLLLFLNQKLDISIILSTFTKTILLPYYYYKNKTTGEVLSRLTDLFSLKSFISKVIVGIFLDTIIFIISFIFFSFINKKILFIICLIIFIYLLILLLFNYPIKISTIKEQECSALTNSAIIEAVSSYETIKNLNIEDTTILNFSKLYSSLLNTVYKKNEVINLIQLFKDLITDIGLLMVSYFSIRLIFNNSLTMGNYLTIMFLSSYLIYPIKNIVDILNEYHYVKNSIIRANNLLNVKEEIFDGNKLEVKGNIIIKNLLYSYNNKNNLLDNISFYINERDRVLIMGDSGVGKSTILKLIYKYFDVERDMIFINNYDINDYSLSDIRKNITYISQCESIFTGTIRNNIMLDRNISEEEFLKVCKITYVDDIVRDNLLGYDYRLEENGVNLSGGQRQRIVLARSLLKNGNIIMIDEGLNEIDVNLERKIIQNIFNEYKDKTFIIISHRKDNMDLYNRMIVIDKNAAKNYVRGDI